MLALSLPALTTTWSAIDSSVIPEDKSARTVADAVNRRRGRPSRRWRSPSRPRPARAPRCRRSPTASRGVDGVERVAPPRVPRLGHLAGRARSRAGDPSGPAAQGAVEAIRALPAPFDVRVGGGAAEFVDQQAAIGSRLLLAIALLVGLTLIVLWLMTGSVVLPVKAVVMNALTVGAALTPLVLIYQGGHLTGLLGYTPNGGVEPSDFLVTAAIVFALSTDYGVFLLGRIKEARDAGLPDSEAVATGLARTGRVVTAAAILMAVAIGAFRTSSISFIQQIGVATATGVLIDAFVVRTLLVPSLMALLGRWNWWSPPPLRRLHAPDRDPRGRRGSPYDERRVLARLARSPTLGAWLPVVVLPPVLLAEALLTDEGPGRDRVRARRRGRRLPAARAARPARLPRARRRC